MQFYKFISLPIVFFYIMFEGNMLYAQVQVSQPKTTQTQASSLPIELQEGSPAPYTGYLLSLDLGAKLMHDSELALKVPLLESLNATNEAIISQQNTEITALKDDKKQLLDTNQKIQDNYNQANKYNTWIYAGFFALGTLFAIGIVLVTGYALEKVNSKPAVVSTAPALVKF